MTAVQRLLIGGGVVAVGLAWALATPDHSEAQFNFPKFNQNMGMVPCGQLQGGIGGIAGFQGGNQGGGGFGG
ncbi:MAG TPA: hypothetical protein VKA46_43085, partial [Gemmataceae bacterium]|nr:hypothetical protein [Gemmataceae bacterium]